MACTALAWCCAVKVYVFTETLTSMPVPVTVHWRVLGAGSCWANVWSQARHWRAPPQPHVEIYSRYNAVRWQFSEWFWGSNLSLHSCVVECLFVMLLLHVRKKVLLHFCLFFAKCWPIFKVLLTTGNATTTTTTTTVLRPFVWDYPGEPVPEETLTHPPSWSSSNLYQLLPSTTIHSILPAKIMWLAIFLRNLSPCPWGSVATYLRCGGIFSIG